MLIEEKPPLNEDLLVHFGVKGMKWGVRRAARTASRRSSGGDTIRGILKSRIYESAKNKARGNQGMNFTTKVGLATVVVGGSVAVGYILAKRGDAKRSSQEYSATAQAGQNARRSGTNVRVSDLAG